MTLLLAIGTKKGLFLGFSKDGRSWEVGPAQFSGRAIYSIALDKYDKSPKIHVGFDSEHFGPSTAISTDLGKSWDEQDQAPIAFPRGTDATVQRVWQITPAGGNIVYAGTQPSALWRSEDGGRTYALVESLWNHPHRPQWGAGFGGQAIHTILPHPDDPRRVLVAMSTGGVYRTEDAGETWAPSNEGIKAYFLPDPWPEYGQCVHKVARDGADPDRYYAQNHHGVYRSVDGGASWQSIADTLPADFGFPIVAHPTRGGTVWNFPLHSDGERQPVGLRCRVYRTTDAGDTWQPQDSGLPAEPYYPVVLRDAMCTDDNDPVGVYFGSRCGDVFGSNDEGETWTTVASHLPDVLVTRAVTL